MPSAFSIARPRHQPLFQPIEAGGHYDAGEGEDYHAGKQFRHVERVALNEREVEVLTWVARGKTSAEIAQILGLTKRTIDFHTDNARSKLGAATRTEAAIKAASGKLIEP
jgi:DNA-binding CsgD family transcriptional regulator